MTGRAYFCATPGCPGYPWPASEHPHPCGRWEWRELGDRQVPDPLLHALQSDPDRALRVLDQARLARGWWDHATPLGGQQSYRWPAHVTDYDRALHSDVDPVGHVWEADGSWHGAACGLDLEGSFASPDAARDAVDAALGGAGWALASGGGR